MIWSKIFQMHNILKKLWLKLCFFNSFTCILKPYILYSFRVFSYADDAYVMKFTLVGVQEKVEGSVAFYS